MVLLKPYFFGFLSLLSVICYDILLLIPFVSLLGDKQKLRFGLFVVVVVCLSVSLGSMTEYYWKHKAELQKEKLLIWKISNFTSMYQTIWCIYFLVLVIYVHCVGHRLHKCYASFYVI